VKFIVIGFTGFIGSEIYKKLLQEHHEVVGINSKIIQFNINNSVSRVGTLTEDVKKIIDKNCVVINTAWVGSQRNNRENIDNIQMAKDEINLINALEPSKIKYVSLGSIAEYEIDEITDSWNTNYAVGKRMVHAHLKDRKSNYVWARIASCFGNRDTRRWLINDFKKGLIGNDFVAFKPKNILNLSDVNNISRIIISLANSNYVGEVNIMDQNWYSVGDLVELYINGRNPNIVTRRLGPFSLSDSLAQLSGENDIVSFILNK